MAFFRSVALVVALTLPGTSPATAGGSQLDPYDRPDASGPLTFQGKGCGKRTARSQGDLVAVLRYCVFLYTLSPTAELDPLRDYGAAWAQTEVDPRNGWCATNVRSEVSLPKQARGHATAPKDMDAGAPKQARTSLVVDAQGLALSNGVLRQTYRLYPGGITGAVSDHGRDYRVTWNGRTNKTLAFAVGREFSVPTGDVLLGELGSFGAGLSSLRFVRAPGC